MEPRPRLRLPSRSSTRCRKRRIDSEAAGFRLVVGGIFEQLYRLARARAGMFMLGRCPNYRSSENLQNCQPLTPAEKFRIASEHSLDRGTFILVESTQVKANGQTRTDLSAWEPLASGTRVTAAAALLQLPFRMPIRRQPDRRRCRCQTRLSNRPIQPEISSKEFWPDLE